MASHHRELVLVCVFGFLLRGTWPVLPPARVLHGAVGQAFSQHLKRQGRFELPKWADVVKTSTLAQNADREKAKEQKKDNIDVSLS